MSLIEVMLGIAVFLIGSVAISNMQLFTIRHSAKWWNMALASNLAAAELEELQITNFNLVLGSQTTYYKKTGEPASGLGDPERYFDVQWRAFPSAALPWTDVEVEVRWKLQVLGTTPSGQPDQSLNLYGRVYSQ